MCADVNSDISSIDLTCPITLEVFHDPVVAGDGRVYEREAITRWIVEHGTSPFTREPLRSNELQADTHMRRICAQKRNSTTSHQEHVRMRTLPPLRKIPRRATVSPQDAYRETTLQTRSTDQSPPPCRFRCIRNVTIVICIVLVAVGITLGVVLGLKPSTCKSITGFYPSCLQ